MGKNWINSIQCTHLSRSPGPWQLDCSSHHNRVSKNTSVQCIRTVCSLHDKFQLSNYKCHLFSMLYLLLLWPFEVHWNTNRYRHELKVPTHSKARLQVNNDGRDIRMLIDHCLVLASTYMSLVFHCLDFFTRVLILLVSCSWIVNGEFMLHFTYFGFTSFQAYQCLCRQFFAQESVSIDLAQLSCQPWTH